MFLAKNLLKFNNHKLSIDPFKLQEFKNLPAEQLPQVVTLTNHKYPDQKFFTALAATNLFQLLKVDHLDYSNISRQSLYNKNKFMHGSQLNKKPDKLFLNQEYFQKAEQVLRTSNLGPGLPDKKFSLIVIDVENRKSDLVGNRETVMAQVLQSLKISFEYLANGGRILVKINGLNGIDGEVRFQKMLNGFFENVEEMNLDYVRMKPIVGTNNMDRRDRYLLCSGYNGRQLRRPSKS